jgi:Domain of unknown function (DUF4160)
MGVGLNPSHATSSWLDPDVRVADNHGYSRRELREIERIAREHVEHLRYEWDRFCTGSSSTA